MSSNNTETGSISSSEESLLIHSALNSLMLSHTFLILLFPLLISLFHFSTPQGRRRPIFILNLLAVFLAFVMGVLLDAVSIHALLEPLNSLPMPFNITIGFLGVWQSIFVDLILLVRLFAVYPPMYLGRLYFSFLIATPVLLKLARIINLFLFTDASVKAATGPNPSVMAVLVFEAKPYLKIEWATQMIDNTYATLAFLWAIRDRGNKRITTSSSTVTLAQRMRTLSRIALTNFLVPTVFSIAQFVSAYRGASMVVLQQLMLVNLMLATFGVAFATVWVGKASRGDTTHVQSSRRGDESSNLPPVFAKRDLDTLAYSQSSASSA